jgi:hypothetical protein
MSLRVLIVPEDFRKDQYMLKPLIKAMFDALDKPNAKIEVCKRPLLRGVDQALDREKLADVFEDYGGMVDLFLLCVDRDCQPNRRDRLDDRELWAETSYQCALIAENAWQEIEVWVLAGHDLPVDWSWQAVRAECDPKEVYFMPFSEQQGVVQTPSEGRKILAEESGRRYDRIKQLCPEDVAELEDKIRAWLKAHRV